MDVQVVQNDDVAGFETWRQLRAHIDVESRAIHGALDDPGGDEFMASEAGHESLGPPFAERRLRPQTLAAGAASPERRHVGLHTGFVDEDQPCWLTAHEGLAPALPLTPRRFDVGTFLDANSVYGMARPFPSAHDCVVDEDGTEDEPMNAIKVLGIDLGKDVCSVVGLDEAGTVLLRRRMRRDSVLKLAAGMPACVMAMEACCGAHHLGRQLREQGHEVRLMSPEYVHPYVKAQKNDDRDAEAIAEAATRPTMRFVDLKSDEQLDMQSLHRARDRLIGERTALINQLRAILLERGIVIAKGRRKLELRLGQLLAGEMAISRRVRVLIEDMRDEWRAFDARIATFDAEFAELAREDASMQLLTTIPGIGPLNATAFVASIGKAETFGRGRDLAAWLGLVPRQMTTGGKPKLLGITKRGNGYLRRMLIHGARAALPSLTKGQTLMGQWLRGLLSRAHMNTAVVALAAKMARIIWAVLRSGRPFEMAAAPAAG